MSGSDVEHVSCLPDSRPHQFRRQSSSSSNGAYYDSPPERPLDTPPTVGASSSLTREPLVDTYPAHSAAVASQTSCVPASVSSKVQLENHNQIGRASPDPDEFYRPHPSVVVEGSERALNSSDTSMVGEVGPATENRSTYAQRALSLTAKTGELPRGSIAQNRSVSDSYYRGRGSNHIKGAAAPNLTARPRQTSFKDLVNKFNQNVDQVLPLPTTSASTSKSPSRAPSPIGLVDSVARSRAPSQLRELRDLPKARREPPSRWKSIDHSKGDFLSRSFQAGVVNNSALETLEASLPRRPFGGLLTVDTGVQRPGLGIPSHLRRRGSEGSIPSPNPALLDNPDRSAGLSPLTPTAWYLGRTPFLEAVSTGEGSSSHRRTRSDLSGVLPVGVVARSPESHMAVLSPLHPGLGGSLESSHSKSRIPISSTRLHTASVAEDCSQLKIHPLSSNRFDVQVPLPPKGISRLPKPSPKSPPAVADDDRTPIGMTSPRRREMTYGRGSRRGTERNTLLEAYIASPPLKKSPPLRSSRPRQPVSQTNSTTPRSRVVETVSTFQRQLNRDRDLRTSRTRGRRLPELGNVDFATRRQKIQQAFNRTVQENERKEEEAAQLRLRAKAQESQRAHDEPTGSEQNSPGDTGIDRSLPSDRNSAVNEISTGADHEEERLISDDGDSRGLPQLQIDTNVAVHDTAKDPNAHPMTMDSPTLGLPDTSAGEHAVRISSPGAADDQSTCAQTPVSVETNITALDPEPQASLSRQSLHASHRTLLSQIMQIRESSPDTSSCDEADYSFSDTEDRVSIPVLLSDAPCSEESVASSDCQVHPDAFVHSDQVGHAILNRWSIGSWSSSLHNQQSTDDHCDGSDDDLSQLQEVTQDGEVATQSCSASSSNAPSVTGHQPTAYVSANREPVTEQKPDVVSERSAYMHPSAPNLARLGGWDSKRVSRLYIEELARGRGHSLPMPAIRASPESRLERRADGRTDSLTDDPVVVSKADGIPPSEQIGHTASLIFRDDWEHASPSIADWMQAAVTDGTGPQEQDSNGISAGDTIPTPRLGSSATDRTGHEQGRDTLGLAIRVQPPQELKSGEIQKTALPSSDPVTQSIANEAINHSQQKPEAALSIQSTQTSSRFMPSLTFAPLGQVESAGSSEDSSLRRLQPTPSSHTLDSSATSLVPSTTDQIRVDIRKCSPSPEQKRVKKRKHVIKELVDTEYSFGRDMKVVDDIYKGTSSSCLDLSPEDVKILFGNSDQIVQFSMSFQDALKEAARSVYVMPKSQRWSSKRSARNNHTNASRTDSEAASGADEVSDTAKDRSTFIGQVFLAHIAPMEKVYADYLKNHDAANKKLQVLQRNPKVAIWLKECREWASDLTTAWDLDSLLVKPVQRILKYPLLLTEILDSTPSDHPDRPYLVNALEEVTNISVRINEMKKRAELVGQVVGRKRKESDVRTGLSKAFGRRTEKLRQQVGLSDMFEDKQYDTLSQRFGDSFFQLQVVMRDVEMYTREVQSSLDRFSEFVAAIEGFVDVAQSGYLDVESRWRDLKMAVREIMATALPEHLAVVRKNVIDPMVTLLKLYDGPQRVMKKRDKRLMDHARFNSIKDRGDKPDKKTTEQSEQFVALNETLKDELPKLYSLTAKMMEACLKNFVHIQTTWFNILQKRLADLIDPFPDDIQQIIGDWSANFTLAEAQVLSLGMCNGSLLADTINLVNFNTPSTAPTISSPRRPSTVNSTSTRIGSTMGESPKVSHDFGNGSNIFQSPSLDAQSLGSYGRHRADSAISGRAAPESSEIPRSQILQQITNSSSASVAPQPKPESFPSLPRLSLDSPFLVDIMATSSNNDQISENPPTSPGGRYSGFFSSAMPMSDNPQDDAPVEDTAPKEPTVLFLAASIYEFNIDRARREAGYPYLTYVAGEIFDVIAEKGELWLAINQDDPTHQVGWIWNKHFAKLSS
ncbi:hypothetical protein CNMCM8980_002185 [Aspergillus fumigatiaffinis]|uniref:Dynamin-binding protein n=1 Tax=Aspergillus fumigatiaffinis TaxID=340414 RepID=A0A8H4M3J0_9EURO|nr:hypothetical protein CNMCM5878_004044 [Aspergillus fumigatiaffinis]KAF4220337.1 hypothetical protein CNMCM6457_002474 [Aspergillus fumigatiaffinis]KAF4227919.1 hypothetical protein CNMCM6805_002545 [Aspergillus fumigatiaffinis]KAF4238102.1 hypothetical protein CNMCM8980_002185 [Aspergillus fumigatiaffinis]